MEKTSRAEDQVQYWLTQAGFGVVRNNWQLIKSPSHHKMEIDIYIPKYKFAIELDGSAYHKEDPKLTYNKWQLITRGGKLPCYAKWAGYHKYKDDQCAKKGIKLIHVCSEDVWDFPEQTKNYIFSELQSWCTLMEEQK